MTSKISIMGIAMAAATTLASCLSDNDTTVITYNDAAITAFSMSSVKVNHTVTSSTGQDSTYTTSYTPDSKIFQIDQNSGRIFNSDSLTVGTDLSAVLVTLSTRANSYVVVVDSTANPVTATYFSSSDSINFTHNITLRNYSSDGTFMREYKPVFTIEQHSGDSLALDTISVNEGLEYVQAKQAAMTGSTTLLLGKKDGLTSLYASTELGKWQEVATDLGDASLIADGSDALLLANNKLARYDSSSLTAREETSLPEDARIKTLLGSIDGVIYALDTSGDSIRYSADRGLTWTTDTIQKQQYVGGTPVVDNSKYWPKHNLSLLQMGYENDGNVYNAIIGNDADNAATTLWTKSMAESLDNVWYYTPQYVISSRKLPAMNNLQAVAYKNFAYGVGESSTGVEIYTSDDCCYWVKLTSTFVTNTLAGYSNPVTYSGTDGNLHILASKDGMYKMWTITDYK